MPAKRYIFKKDYLTLARANGLMKNLLEQIIFDRDEAADLYNQCKERLIQSGESNLEFAALMSSASTALNLMMNTNKKIIETITVIHKFLGAPPTAKGAGLDSPGSSLFSQLSKLTSKKEPDEETI